MRKENDIIKILTIVFAVLIVGFGIFMVIYFTTASKKIRSLNINPDFTETELGVNSEYTFTVSANSEKASLKKVECECDNGDAKFEMGKDGKATLTTGAGEGTVTIYVKYKDIKSNVLSFQIVDLAARAQAEAAAAAEAEALAAEAQAAEAEAQAAAEAAAAAKMYCMMTGDNVNVRSQNNTDCEILGKAKKGDKFEKVEIVDDWTHIIFNGQDAYVKSEYLSDITEEEFNGGAATETATADTNKEEKKEEKKEENNTTSQTTDTSAADAQAQAEAQAAAAAQQAADELAAQQAAALAAQQAAAAMGTPIHCKDGTCYVTAAQLNKIHATWDFAGDAIEMAGHHSIGELEAVVGPTQH